MASDATLKNHLFQVTEGNRFRNTAHGTIFQMFVKKEMLQYWMNKMLFNGSWGLSG